MWTCAAAFVQSLIFVGLLFTSNACGQTGDLTPMEFAVVGSTYDLEIVSKSPGFPHSTSWGPIDGQSAALEDLQRYEPLFCEEFSLYPKSLVRKTKLRRIVMCHELKLSGQRRYAIPDFEHDTLYLDVGMNDQPAIYLRKVIHHEFFHIIDYRDDGLLYEDERWKSLNRPDFMYGKGGAAALGDSTTGELTTKYAGFLTHYATTGVEEDKAEVFAHLIVNAATVTDRVAGDEILADKIDQMKSLVQTFCAEADQTFWVRAGKLPRPVE